MKTLQQGVTSSVKLRTLVLFSALGSWVTLPHNSIMLGWELWIMSMSAKVTMQLTCGKRNHSWIKEKNWWHANRTWALQDVLDRCFNMTKHCLMTNCQVFLMPQPLHKNSTIQEILWMGVGTRIAQWAYCFRVGLGIKSNMFVEAFHKVFKYQYSKGKTNKRLDNCQLNLFKYVRDDTFHCLIKLTMKKLQHA